jgi:hypothetical protein
VAEPEAFSEASIVDTLLPGGCFTASARFGESTVNGVPHSLQCKTASSFCLPQYAQAFIYVIIPGCLTPRPSRASPLIVEREPGRHLRVR